MEKEYILKNLCCPNCAAKIEAKINELEEVESAHIHFDEKELHLHAENPDALIDKITEICKSVEEDIEVVEEDECECGCGHHHDHDHEEHDHCDCDHDHDYHHHHDDDDDDDDDECECGCGHHHHHDDDDDDDDECECGCGHHHHDHEHEHEHEHHHHHHEHIEGAVKKKYILENLGCAHCAAKMEAQIAELDGVEDAIINYPTKLLHLTAKDPDSYLDQVQEICSSIESQVVVKPQKAVTKSKSTAIVPAGKKPKKSKKEKEKTRKKFILAASIIIAIAAFIGGHFATDSNIKLIIYLVAYIILAKNVITEAIHGIGQGQVFDENFLMSIATIGALLIGEYPEALGVILFYRIGEAFEDYAVDKSRASIMEAVNMRPETVLQFYRGETIEIPAEEARKGMTIVVRPGDRIPLDGIVVEGESQIDTSALTGEPVPVSVKPESEILSGCVNQTGLLKLKVTKPLEESMVTRIMESMENAAASKPKIDRFITRFSKFYTPIVVLIALCTAIIPSTITGNWDHWVYTALTFLVISCPCALVLSVPLSFFSGIGLGSRQGILFKGGASLEVLKDVKAVVMDKTGTITKGNFVVHKLEPAGAMMEDELLALAATCEQNSTHPIAKSILNAADERGIILSEPSRIIEVAGRGIDAVVDGHDLLCGNDTLMASHHINIPDLDHVYGTVVLLALDGKYAGRVVISDTLKEESRDSIENLNLIVQTVMLTGDSEDAAKAIAEKTGVNRYYAKLLPDDKLKLLQDLRKEYGPVMFVGDGINDAPVLAGADCGAAMGNGADAAIEAADVVFMTSKLSAISESIRIAQLTNNTAMQNIVFALAVKAAVMVLGLIGIASMWLAVFADTGVAVLCILNSIRILRDKKSQNQE